MITLVDGGKRYNRQWLFRNLQAEFLPESVTAITGSNGSGKSTLLKILAGYISLTEGSIAHTHDAKQLEYDQLTLHSTIAAPYLDLIEAFTLREAVAFHQKFKRFKSGASITDILQFSGLHHKANVPISNFSSGMKQRVKLVLAICTDSPFLFLDEPCSNLDSNAVEWYNDLLSKNLQKRTVVICSNSREGEIRLAQREIRIESF